MGKWPKPAEGSWTEHYPELGTGPISFRDSTSPEFYELEREAIFKRAWLNVGRVEELPRVGSYFTKEIDAAKTSVIVVKGKDQQIRAFYNICRHRGNKLVWNDFPNEEVKGTCRQFTCKYHGWRYDLDGALTFVQQQGEFFDLDKAQYGLRPVHCDVWNGFIFINFDPEPRQSLREFLGPMITALDDYPFDMMTERYDFVAHNNSNWKIFADAFQEYYHVPSLHPQQVPTEVRQPNAGIRVRALPDRRSAPAGVHRRYPPLAARARVHVPDRTGHPQRTGRPVAHARDRTMSAGLNPGGIEPWGITNFQIFPNLEILIYRGWYLLYRYWPTSHNTHKFEAYTAFHPARTVRERIEHEVAVGGAQGVRAAGRGHARRHAGGAGVPASSTTSRSTTRRSWCATCTRWPSTGSTSTSASARRRGCDR